jgi:hypothetical protein
LKGGMGGDPATDFWHFCVIAAALRERTVDERHAILESLGLTSRWPGIRSHWAHVLLDDAGRGDLSRVQRFEEACAHDRLRRREGDDVFGPASRGEEIALEVQIGPRLGSSGTIIPPVTVPPVTVVGLPTAPKGIEVAGEAPPSITMDSSPPSDESGSDAAAPVLSGGPQTLEMPAFAADGEPPTEIPNQPRRLTARSAGDAALAALRRAMRWSVEHYAAFSAALAVRPNDHHGVAAEFDVTVGAIHNIVTAWEKKLDLDPNARESYRIHYEASLQHRKPTS